MKDILPGARIANLFSGRLKWVSLTAVIISALLIARFVFFLYSTEGEGNTVRIVDFAKGSSLRKLSDELEKGGVIGSSTLFMLYGRISGLSSKVKAGTYQFTDAMSPLEIFRKLESGDVYEKKFAVPEGYSIFQIAEMLDSRGFFKKEPFLKECRDPRLLEELGIRGPSVEGYLYPSTYNLLKAEDPAALIKLMVGQFRKVYDERFAAMEKNSHLTRSQIITLASIVEKEAVAAQEKPLIASVFFNRLKNRMPLQSDPTAVYGTRAFGGKVSGSDVRRDSAYNTYKISGLPPGPIGNPGAGAIEAVLQPATTGYYYFVAKNDGTHHFSANLDEHNRAVRLHLKSGSSQTGSPEYKNDRPNITGRR
jgi:peptidoglycan lytic transglycosylase G